MKPYKLTLGLSSILLLGAFNITARAAETIKIDVVSEEKLAPTGPPGRIWVSDGVQHTRDFPLSGPVWGDLNGNLSIIFNTNLNLATGDGTAFGSFVLAVEWNGFQGTFEGRSKAKYQSFLVTNGYGVGHGTGDFEGMQIQLSFFHEGDRVPLIGTIIMPGGE
jgi:hypothetical protein